METIFNGQLSIRGFITLMSLLILVGSICHWAWKDKGMLIYVGCIIILMGILVILAAFFDTALTNK
jgi:hypothetical protein